MVWIDVAASDELARAGKLVIRHEGRQIREVARLMRLGIDPLDALRDALAWAQDRLEFGTTHAIGAAPDWLQLGMAAF